MKILIVGSTGMLGYSLFNSLSSYSEHDVYGTVRSIEGKERFFNKFQSNIIPNIDITNIEELDLIIGKIKPNVVINCIGLIKQHEKENSTIESIYINALFPHQLASLCDKNAVKLIHFSTDCVFSGNKGGYCENDTPDAPSMYGRTKLIGEIDDDKHLTLRTSIIGHELSSTVSLIDWFLNQENSTNGFTKAIFSGIPTCHIAKVLNDYVLPNYNLTGLFHLSVEPINKYDLLKKVSFQYGKEIEINESDTFVTNKSLDSTLFMKITGYRPPSWDSLVKEMHVDYMKTYQVN
ncbi:dTDP-4-dehydrorhamnose reductase family protein [Vibrio splendidus]